MAGHLECVAFISMPGTGEWMVILFIGLLIFGRRLPEVARSLGKSVNEFKKGLKDFQDSADGVASDVNRMKNDVVNDVASQVNEASGADNTGGDSHGYPYNSGESVTNESTTQPEATTAEPAQPAGPTDQNPGVENVEPMK
jgi:sec-independent protein translocase protein TatA